MRRWLRQSERERPALDRQKLRALRREQHHFLSIRSGFLHRFAVLGILPAIRESPLGFSERLFPSYPLPLPMASLSRMRACGE
ncbi:hypothetical protein GCWU000341_01485 [Oribacterium sp. oral taxon 078 str. F0262]|nr:hypothetical protein GCWU000341_01485 [Oribacterium sp. oral taxon 078 str. F0262]